ncbi:putative DNA primase/helicase, partial [Pseudomonas lutea]
MYHERGSKPTPFYSFCADRFPTTIDSLTYFFKHAQAAAAEIGGKLDQLPHLDGERHYLSDLEGKADQRHYYVGSVDQDKDGTVWPCVTFGTFKDGGRTALWKPRNLAWTMFQGEPHRPAVSDEQHAEYARQAEAVKAKAEAAKAFQEAQAEEGQRAAAQAACEAWQVAQACTVHGYLTLKNIAAYGLRLATANRKARLWHKDEGRWIEEATVVRAGDLLIPAFDTDGQLVNLQRIDSTGKKRFVMGGKVKGTFFRIEGNEPVWLVEGYATGSTVRAATGCAAIVAFSAGNLPAVAKPLAGQLQAVAADNDESGAGLKGAELTGLPHVMPPTVGQDWNDFAAAHGLAAVATELSKLQLQKSQFVSVDFPDLSAKGNPLNTLQNLEALLAALHIEARYNLVSKSIEIQVPGLIATVDNRANVALTELSSHAARHRMPRESLMDYIKAIADRRSYSPIAEWICSKSWDGRDRVSTLIASLETENNQLRDVLVKRWLISAVAAAMRPNGMWSKGVLTLQGEQNLGKTSWFRALVPAELRHLLREGLCLDAQNKDSVMTAVSHWLVELGELEATLRRDMEALKAFITQTVDRLRRPYDRVDSEFPRRTVFCASVNSDRFLKDATGNTRFWVLRCLRINHAHGLDMQQVWAQVFEQYYQAGEQWHLTEWEEELL